MDKETVDRAINNYYKLKKEYEDALYKQKKRILKNTDLTKREKKKQFNRIRHKCINCKKTGGTVFTNKDRILKAVCGNTKQPCKLNIEIKKGEYIQMNKMMDILFKDLETNKTSIIKTKLEFLFGYIDEEAAREKFEENKDDYAGDFSIYTFLENSYNNIINKNKENLYEENINLYGFIDQFRDHIRQYYDESNTTYIKEAVELYLTQIRPVVEKIREYKYRVMKVDYDEDEEVYILNQEPYSLEDTEMILGDEKTKVISDIRGT
jgi:hypothetical protein